LKERGTIAAGVNRMGAVLIGSGWHPPLFRAEVAALFDNHSVLHRRVIEVDSGPDERWLTAATITEVLSPAATSRWMDESSVLTKTIATWVRENLSPNGRSLAVRASALDAQSDTWDGGGVERSLGEALVAAGWSIDLDNPDVTLRIILAGPSDGAEHPDPTPIWDDHHLIAWGVRIHQSKHDWESRSAPKRPFFKPIGLDPRLARVMVSLAIPTCSSSRPTFVDPFCGTGGLLMEAVLTGCETIGYDLDQQMVAGATSNLAWLSDRMVVTGKSNVRIGDATSFELAEPASGFAFDPPYGRNSWRSDEALDLFIQALANCRDNATDDARLVALLPWPPSHLEALRRGESPTADSLRTFGSDWRMVAAMVKEAGWAILDEIPVAIHSSLSRLLLVCGQDHPDA